MRNYVIILLFLTTLSLFAEKPNLTKLPLPAPKPTFTAQKITNNTVNITIDQRQTSAVENVLAAQQRPPERPKSNGSKTFFTTIFITSLVIAGDLAYEAFWNIIDF